MRNKKMMEYKEIKIGNIIIKYTDRDMNKFYTNDVIIETPKSKIHLWENTRDYNGNYDLLLIQNKVLYDSKIDKTTRKSKMIIRRYDKLIIPENINGLQSISIDIKCVNNKK